jgi:hypothetical protein
MNSSNDEAVRLDVEARTDNYMTIRLASAVNLPGVRKQALEEVLSCGQELSVQACGFYHTKD